MSDVHTGACLCGAVSFRLEAPLGPATACHCSQCRRQSGHYWASTDVPRDALELQGADNLTWYQASPRVRRGFCRTCGAFLFWDAPRLPTIAVAMGAWSSPTGTRLTRHIFVASASDYYDLADGVPQSAE